MGIYEVLKIKIWERYLFLANNNYTMWFGERFFSSKCCKIRHAVQSMFAKIPQPAPSQRTQIVMHIVKKYVYHDFAIGYVLLIYQ